jgi:hypothetical protein
MLGALTRLAPVSPTAPISPIVPPTKKLEVISPRPDFSNRRPAVQPPAAPPGAGLPPPGAGLPPPGAGLPPPGSDASSGGGSGAGDSDAGKKFPIVPVAIGVAVLAFLLMRR